MYSRDSAVYLSYIYTEGTRRQKFIKELAYLPADQTNPNTYLFLPPYNYNELDAYGVRFQHGFEKRTKLKWNSGTMPYTYLGEVLDRLERSGSTVLVNSQAKKSFLERYLSRVEVIPDFPPFKEFYCYKNTCSHHLENSYICAAAQTFLMQLHCEKNNNMQ